MGAVGCETGVLDRETGVLDRVAGGGEDEDDADEVMGLSPVFIGLMDVIGLSPVFIGLIYEISVFDEPSPGAACALTESRDGDSEEKLFFLFSDGRLS
jgi:hypothetical protein